MSYVEPNIPTAPFNDEESRTPAAPGLLPYQISERTAIGHGFAKLPTYTPGTDEPPAAALPAVNTAALFAVVTIEAAPGSTAAGGRVVRFWLDGSWPTQTTGIALKDGDRYEINGSQDVANARFVSADGLAHVIQVQYFNKAKV